MSKKGSGFTLIELLVVIAIMGITGIFALSNYRSFGEDQNLKNAVLDTISLLRQAQTNATANVVCAATWQVEFAADSKTINLKCVNTQKTLQQYTYTISGTTANGSDCLATLPFTISFAALSGRIDFVGTTCTSLTVDLTNNSNTKSLKIEQGGRIYAQ